MDKKVTTQKDPSNSTNNNERGFAVGYASYDTCSHTRSLNLRKTGLMSEIASVQACLQHDDKNRLWMRRVFTHFGQWNRFWHAYHGLYGSTNCCISQWPSQSERANFDTPQLRNRLIDFNENWILELSLEDHTPCKNFTSIRQLGWSRRIPMQFATVGFLSLSFFFGLFITRTGLSWTELNWGSLQFGGQQHTVDDRLNVNNTKKNIYDGQNSQYNRVK